MTLELFGLCVAGAIIILLVISVVSPSIGRWRIARRLRKEGRLISQDDAIVRSTTRKGIFVRNQTRLPNEVWWLEEFDEEVETIAEALEQRGFAISSCEADVVMALQATGQQRQLIVARDEGDFID